MRHELKYMIGPTAAATLKKILPALLSYDPHYEDGHYTVSSLYFDDLSFSAYNDKMNGEEDREKFRIRLYNGDESYLVLEKKCKKNDMVNKYSYLMNKNAVLCAIGGKSIEGGCDLAKEFNAKVISQGLRPVLNVKYERTAFVFPVGGTRITIDENIRFSLDSRSLFDGEIPFFPLPFESETVLEVKYGDVFPSFLVPVLSSVSAERTAYSKYAMAVSAIEGSYI
ncbi:MAG: polyphosphate polymerase domain-containing protein [Clostridia bacterium]|nr:polyphosphate polymerase domain-containing protein [Clostridia bacterium]